MFWKKKQTEAKPKAKKLSPAEILVSRLEQLSLGQSLVYRLAKVYGGDLVIVDLNPRYPNKGQRKYRMSTERLVDGKPCGQTILWYFEKPKNLAKWILERNGVPLIELEVKYG